MKTLDEVIKAFEWCNNEDENLDDCTGCPYNTGQGTDCHERNVDALYYLKEYRACGQCAYADSYLRCTQETDNPALTWDELKQMEGKPVWVEQHHGDTKGWLLILRKCDDVVTCTTKHGNSFYLYKANYGEKWQAYRKERE